MGTAALIAIKVALMILGILLSVIRCTIACGILVSTIYGLKAIGLPASLVQARYTAARKILIGGAKISVKLNNL